MHYMWQCKFDGEAEKIAILISKLSPVFELTAQVRPRLLLAALTAKAELITFGLLYHTKRKAFRSCLRFALARQPEFVRCTRWRQWASQALVAARYAAIVEGFVGVASQLGTEEILRLDFAKTATDDEILEVLLTSQIAPLVIGKDTS